MKNNKKREREYDRRNMKKVGVQPSFDELNAEMPMQGIIPTAPGTPENAEVENTVVENTVVENTVVENTVTENPVTEPVEAGNTAPAINTETPTWQEPVAMQESVAETPVTQDVTLS